jgi:hypothetical protein
MKCVKLFSLSWACLFLMGVPTAALAGGAPSAAPEPTSILVWAGLAGAGGLMYWRQQRRKR